jgi:hypothetical protein
VIDGSKFKGVNNRDKNFTRAKMEPRLAQIEESVARYLHQLDSADRQEPSLARETKTIRLKEKIAKLKGEVWRQHGLKARMLAAPDQQISLTDPDSRSCMGIKPLIAAVRAPSLKSSDPTRMSCATAIARTTNLLERLFAETAGNDAIEECFPRSVDDQPFDAIGR